MRMPLCWWKQTYRALEFIYWHCQLKWTGLLWWKNKHFGLKIRKRSLADMRSCNCTWCCKEPWRFQRWNENEILSLDWDLKTGASERCLVIVMVMRWRVIKVFLQITMFYLILCSVTLRWMFVMAEMKVMVGCIDKWVKSKFDNVTPPELCSGPI